MAEVEKDDAWQAPLALNKHKPMVCGPTIYGDI